MVTLLTIGEVSRRSGVAASALRFYEERGLITSERAGAGHRRYPRAVLRRIAFIVFAQRVGLTLEEIGAELAKLPPGRAPNSRHWSRLSRRMEVADRSANRRARAPQDRPHRVHRVRLSVAGPLPARQSRRPRRRARPWTLASWVGDRPPRRLPETAGSRHLRFMRRCGRSCEPTGRSSWCWLSRSRCGPASRSPTVPRSSSGTRGRTSTSPTGQPCGLAPTHRAETRC